MKKTTTESTVSQVVVSKRKKNNSGVIKSPELVERICRILDASILEVVPDGEPTYKASIFLVMEDIYDKTVLTLDLSQESLNEMGYNFTTREMINLCSWFKTYRAKFTITLPADETRIKFTNLFDSLKEAIQEPRAQEIEEEDEGIELTNIDSKATTVVQQKKFGIKK